MGLIVVYGDTDSAMVLMPPMKGSPLGRVLEGHEQFGDLLSGKVRGSMRSRMMQQMLVTPGLFPVSKVVDTILSFTFLPDMKLEGATFTLICLFR
jgi:hypothetical protein